LVYYGNPRELEYDLVVAPGANPLAIEVEYEGVESLRLDGGDLVLTTASGELRQKRPQAYQESRAIKVGYRVMGKRRVGFELANHNRANPLTIDPVLLYSTYLGGVGQDYGNGTTVDRAGNAYVTGFTGSLNFPTTSPLQGGHGGGTNDAFVTKLNS